MDTESDASKALLPPTLPRWWRVLPSLVLMILIGYIDGLILNDFIEYRYTTYYQVNSSSTSNSRELCLNATQQEHNSSHLISTTTSKYPISTTMSPTDRVQEATAHLNVYISIASTIPALLTAILLGANCDIIGRKPLIVLPFVGKILRYSTLTAAAYFNLSDLWIVLAVIFDSAFGTSGLSLLTSFSYVSDCTNEKTRTSAIIIVDVCISAIKIVPLLTIGIYLQHPRFIQSMLFTLLLCLGGFVFSVVLQPESNLNVQHLNIFQQLKKTRLQPVTKIFRVFLAKREGHKQRSLLFLVGTHLCMITMSYGNLAMFYIYLYGAPFCFDSLGVSLNSVAQTVAMVLLTIPFTLTISKHSDHLAFPILGCLSFMTQLVLFALVNQVWMIYLAACIGSLYNILIPVIRSRVSKSVEPNEYAVVFIFAMIFESGGSFAISAMTNEIYAASITFFPGLVFIVLAMFGAMAIILMLILYVLEYQPSAANANVYLNN